MSFGLSPSDIAKGLEIAKWIYDFGFDSENRAVIRYCNFQKEIEGLYETLKSLKRTLSKTSRRYELEVPRHANTPSYSTLAQEAVDLVGHFVETLTECKTLLEKQKQVLSRGRAMEVYEGIAWEARTKNKVNELRQRLQFHMKKLLLAVNGVSLQMATDTANNLDDLLGLTEHHIALSTDTHEYIRQLYINLIRAASGQPLPDQLEIDRTHVVSDSLVGRFEANLEVNAPKGFQDRHCSPLALPLSDGFDALLMWFSQSSPSSSPTENRVQYLNLMKARWLLDALMASEDYTTSRPGSCFKRAINQVGQQVIAKIRNPGLIPVSTQDMLELPETAFYIWQVKEPFELPDLREDFPTEEELLSVDLVPRNRNEATRLFVFRRSDKEFIIVTRTSYANGQTVDKEYPFMAHEDRLIPRYALPALTTPCNDISIFYRGREVSFKFQTTEDMWSFQNALMGYQVVSECQNVDLSFSKSSLNCVGRVQIWQDPIDQRTAAASSSPDSEGSPTFGHSISSRRSSVSRPSGRVNSIDMSTIRETSDGFHAEEVPLPALAIFAKLDDEKHRSRLGVIFVELNTNLEIVAYPNADGTRSKDLYLEHRNRGSFQVHVLLSDIDTRDVTDPNTWDLLEFRKPRHPKFSSLAKKNITFLVLHFKSLMAKGDFQQEIQERFQLRDHFIRLQARQFAETRRDADRPRRYIEPPLNLNHSPSLTMASYRNSSMSSLASIPRASGHRLGIQPPVLEEPDVGVPFAEDMAHMTDEPRHRRTQVATRRRATEPTLPPQAMTHRPRPTVRHSTPERDAESFTTASNTLSSMRRGLKKLF